MLGSIKYPRPQPNSTELRDQLRDVVEFGLERDTDDPIVKDLIEKDKHRLDEFRQIHPFAPVIDEVESLPLLMGSGCKLSPTAAKSLETRSRQLRDYMFRAKEASELQKQLAHDEGGHWVVPAAIPTLVQILQTEGDDFRLLLVELLSRTPGRAASRALATRAVFDLSSEVRHAAIRALGDRAHKEYRDVLIGGLRHPWPAAADFAAAALVGVHDRYAIPSLVKLLDQPNPSGPFTVTEGNEQGHYVREMVRVNHNRNCILCHAVSVKENEFVRAAIPNPKAPLPPPFSPAYYHERFSDDSRTFVRADVTYLRQDFSLVQEVGGTDPSRQRQRFDFCVRIRPLSNDEWAIKSLKPIDNPQRDAVLFALRELSGEDRGRDSANWRQIATRFSN